MKSPGISLACELLYKNTDPEHKNWPLDKKQENGWARDIIYLSNFYAPSADYFISRGRFFIL